MSEGAPRRILVVDDDAYMRRLIEVALEMDGAWAVTSVDSGGQAIAAFEAERPDIVLLDAQMPEMNGEETLARLRALPGPEATTFIMLTGHSGPALAHLESLPLAGVLTKPIIPDELGARLRAIADR